MINLRQSIKIAAFETARIAIIPGVQDADVRMACDLYMKARRIKDYELQISPPLSDVRFGDELKITIDVPSNQCAIISSWFYRSQHFVETVGLMVEY